MATDSVREFFAGLATRVDPAKTAGMTNSYLFDVDGAGTWTVRVTNGAVSVREGPEDADVTITGDAETFDRISKRELNATTAYMTGKIKVKGDMGAALKLQKLF
jgi:putative sterol carrier protein